MALKPPPAPGVPLELRGGGNFVTEKAAEAFTAEARELLSGFPEVASAVLTVNSSRAWKVGVEVSLVELEVLAGLKLSLSMAESYWYLREVCGGCSALLVGPYPCPALCPEPKNKEPRLIYADFLLAPTYAAQAGGASQATFAGLPSAFSTRLQELGAPPLTAELAGRGTVLALQDCMEAWSPHKTLAELRRGVKKGF